MAKELYNRLGVAETATREEINLAYKALAMKHHPDQADQTDPEAVAAAEAVMKGLNEARDILTDDRRRKDYDARGFVARSLSDAEIDKLAHDALAKRLVDAVQLSISHPLAPRPENIDMMRYLRDWTAEMRGNTAEGRQKMNQATRSLNTLLENFEHHGPADDHIKRVLEDNLKSASEQLAQLDDNDRVCERYDSLLAEYTYRQQNPGGARPRGGPQMISIGFSGGWVG